MCQTSSEQALADYQQNGSNLHPQKVQGIRSYCIEDALTKTSECSINKFNHLDQSINVKPNDTFFLQISGDSTTF